MSHRTVLLIAGAALLVVGYHDTFGWNGQFTPWSPLPTTVTPVAMIGGAALIGYVLHTAGR